MSKPMILGTERQALLARPLKDTSVDDLEHLFLGAAKADTQWFVGLELELLSFERETLLPLGHRQISGVLDRLGKHRAMQQEHEASGALVGLKGDGQSVSLEPGGQLEFASRPHRSLKKLRQELFDYMADLKAAAGEGVGFWAIGQQPFVDRDSAPKMPKPRYDMMRRYFGQRGARALDMMHLTGSIQCTVDFLDEKNLVDKVRTACRASPFLSALVAASPFSSGQPNGFKSVRYQIWLETGRSSGRGLARDARRRGAHRPSLYRSGPGGAPSLLYSRRAVSTGRNSTLCALSRRWLRRHAGDRRRFSRSPHHVFS